MPTPSLYTREKNPAGVWRYKRVKEGRGVKTGDLDAPFFTRPVVHGKQLSKTLSATTFKEAKEEAAQLTAALDAHANGLTVTEADAITNANRNPVRTAVDTYLEQKSGKAKKTVAQYRLALNNFLNHSRAKSDSWMRSPRTCFVPTKNSWSIKAMPGTRLTPG